MSNQSYKGSEELNKLLLEQIYNDLLNGRAFRLEHTWQFYDKKPDDYPFFGSVLYYDGKYFHWHSVGSSAVEATIDKLAWLLNNIFGVTPYQFVNMYVPKEKNVDEKRIEELETKVRNLTASNKTLVEANFNLRCQLGQIFN